VALEIVGSNPIFHPIKKEFPGRIAGGEFLNWAIVKR
jgi:hypothetical protein